MYITYYADNSTMGDNSARDCAKYRDWAWDQLEAQYPAHDITVANQTSLHQVSTNDDDHRDEIEDFVSRLWDRCPWDWE